jgi:hypothetical protein
MVESIPTAISKKRMSFVTEGFGQLLIEGVSLILFLPSSLSINSFMYFSQSFYWCLTSIFLIIIYISIIKTSPEYNC